MLESKNWLVTLVLATLAVAFAAFGLASTSIYPGATPIITTSTLLASLACTVGAFGMLASRVHRLELENEGLIEEISQEFDRVKDKIDIFAEALTEPRTLETSEPATMKANDEPLRRVAIK